jgi:hypothetical protein
LTTHLNQRANRNLDNPVEFTRKDGSIIFHYSDCNALKSDHNIPGGTDMRHVPTMTKPITDTAMELLIQYAHLLEKSDAWPDWACKLCRNSYEKAKNKGLIA